MIGKNIFKIFGNLLFLLSLSPLVYALDLTEFSQSPFITETEKTISMDFKDAALVDVLKIFSQQSGLNFVASDQIASKTLNLYLDKVTVEEALERILSANKLTYELKAGSNIFIVKELKETDSQLITRVYKLKHATVPSSKLNIF